MAFIPAGAEDDIEIGEGPWEELDFDEYQVRLLHLEGLGGLLYDDDEDFDFDDMDDDDYLSDDFYFSDEVDANDSEDNVIYDTLQDAPSVLPHLQFVAENKRGNLSQKGNEQLMGAKRSATLVFDGINYTGNHSFLPETYESLHRLLEEVERLLKTWKRRVSHPFVAHLQRKKRDESQRQEESNMDFSGTDIESDDQEMRSNGLPRSDPKISENLTRKKYCLSTKLFFEIFDTDLEIDQLIGQIKKIRKYVHTVAFSMFFDCIGEDSLFETLPVELQDKIWTLTQTPYSGAFQAGYRFKDDEELVEKERINALFGAVGNLHIILFEILFKRVRFSPHEVQYVFSHAHHGGGMQFGKYVFQKYVKMMRTAFQRLKAMSVSNEGEEELSLSSKIEKGIFTLHVNEHPRGKANKLNEEDGYLALVVDEGGVSQYIVGVQQTLKNGGNDPKLLLRVIDTKLNKTVAFIETRVSTWQLYTSGYEQGSAAITLHRNTVSVVVEESRILSSIKPILIYQWTFQDPKDGHQKPQQLGEKHAHVIPTKIKVQDVYQTINLERSLFKVKTTTLDGIGVVHLLFTFNKVSGLEPCIVNIIDAKMTDVLDKIIWETGDVTYSNLKKDLLVMEDRHSKFILIDLNTRTEVATIDCQGLCQHGDACRQWLLFDQVEDNFVIVCNRWIFKSWSYRLTEGVLTLKETLQGSVLDHHGHMTSVMVYRHPMLLGIQSKILEYEMFSSRLDLYSSASLVAIDLSKGSETCIADIGGSNEVANQRLNVFHSRIEINSEKSGFNGYDLMSDKDTFVFTLGQKQFVTLKIQKNESECLKTDAKIVRSYEDERKAEAKKWSEIEKKLKTKHAKQKVEDAERAEVVKAAKEKYVGKEIKVEGKIHSWKYRQGYGFVRPSGGAESLGNLFVHISDITNAGRSRHPGNQKWIEFNVREDPGKTNFRAINAVLLEKEQPKDGGAAGGGGGGRRKRSKKH